MRERFRYRDFSKKNLILLDKINIILEEYKEQDIKVTLRQLFYQLVARDIIPNKTSSYTQLSSLLTQARYAGEIDWDAIEDRARIPYNPNTFQDVNELMETAVNSYQLNRWRGQPNHVEVWTEKDALTSVILPITSELQVNLCVNRGYTSSSAMYESAKRLSSYEQQDKINTILYLGDHDPSGLDMVRDIKDRLFEFGVDINMNHIALTKEQIKKYNPPPNPAKITDPRAKNYIDQHGEISWEVDALRPNILENLIETEITRYLDIGMYDKVIEQEKKDIQELREKLDF